MEKEIYIQRGDLRQHRYVNFSEQNYEIGNSTDRRLEFKEISFRGLQLVSCGYILQQDENITLGIENDVLEMHFRLAGNSTAVCDSGLQLYVNGGEHSLLFHCGGEKKIAMQKTAKQGRFLEVRASVDTFESVFTQGNDFQKRFYDQLKQGKHYWPGHSLAITPEMHTVVQQLNTCPFTGLMKSFYLEAKVTELLLLQADAYDNFKPAKMALKSSDIEKLQAVKTYLEKNREVPITLDHLSKTMLIPTKKLTWGFKQLFNRTILEYRNELRMEEAKYLLLEEKLLISEVAERIGYLNQQHFTVAFKKYFGYLPSLLKN